LLKIVPHLADQFPAKNLQFPWPSSGRPISVFRDNNKLGIIHAIFYYDTNKRGGGISRQTLNDDEMNQKKVY